MAASSVKGAPPASLALNVANALIAWATNAIPEIASTYPFPKLEDPGPMPELAVDFKQIRTQPGTSAHHRRKQLQPLLSIITEPFPYDTSSQSLWSMADRLIAAQDADRTLGFGTLHQVPMEIAELPAGNILCEFPGIINWPEGTQAREMQVSFIVRTLA